MKKLLYSFMAAGAVAGLASCASDEPMMSGSNDGRVSISVEIPRFSTRAYGDTLNCNQLIYTVYDATGETVIFPDSAVNAFGAGINSANITLQLVPGETYTLVCYAHNTGSQFSSYKEGNITVDYTKLTANDENHDAFYRALPITVDGQGDKKITLNRAFAQINFGTNDLNNPAVQKVIGNFEAKLNITSGLYNTLSCKDSTVSNSDDLATTLAVTNNFTQNSNFPVPGYGNLTSVYVLVGADAGQLLGEGTYVINNGATEVRNVNLASTPVRMNYRTNVYGAMLTTDLPVTVELRPAFEDPNINLPQSPVTVTTSDELKEAMQNGGTIIVPEDAEIEMALPKTGTSNYGMTISRPVNLTVNGKLSLPAELNNKNFSHFYVGEKMTISGGGTINATEGQTLFYVPATGELTLDSVTVNYTGVNGGANPYMIRTIGDVTINKSTINIIPPTGFNYAAILHQNGVLTISDTEINITATSAQCEGVRTQGCTDVFTNVKINSTGGRAYTAERSSDYTRPFNATLTNCEMYAGGDRVLYIYDNKGESVLNMDGGKYSCKVTKVNGYSSPIIFDNNQSGKYFTCNVKNVEFVTQPWGFQTRATGSLTSAPVEQYIAPGYKWEAITPPTTNPVYAWRVVPE